MRSVVQTLLATGLLLAAGPAAAETEIPGISKALDATGRAVVAVEVSRRGAPQRIPALRELTLPLPGMPGDLPGTERLSGVVTDADEGHILTNFAGGADAAFAVRLSDGRKIEARLIGVDRRTGLALLDVDGVDLTAVDAGDAEALSAGDPVVVVSNPFGDFPVGRVEHVSWPGDDGVTPEDWRDFVVFGTPAEGSLRGSAIATLEGRFAGLVVATEDGGTAAGLAVPATAALEIADHLSRFGEVPAGRLGVMVQDLTAEAARKLDLGTAEGAVVSAVAPGSAAEKAGIEPGDVIVSVNAEPVTGADALRGTIGGFRAGDAVAVEFLRDGERRDVELVLGGGESAALTTEAPERVQTALVPGAVFAAGEDGVAVAAVAPNSPSARAGLRIGDRLIAIDRRPVADLAGLRALAEDGAPAASLTIRRDERELFLLLG